jgi:chromate transporter
MMSTLTQHSLSRCGCPAKDNRVTIDSPASSPVVSYSELARLFLRLSITAFGGPVAHIALAEDEIVTRRGWLTREHYLDLVAATNLIPGPNSTEVMIHVGYIMRGIPGAIVAGVCFIGPAFLLTLALAVLYVSSGTIPQVEAALRGIQPVIVAIIASVGYRLVRAALTNAILWLLFALSVAAIVVLHIPEVIVMLASGALYGLYQVGIPQPQKTALPIIFALPSGMEWGASARNWISNVFVGAQHAALLQRANWIWQPVSGVLAAASAVSPLDLFLYFLKIGSVLFGSGYVLIAYIQQDVVNTFGWLTTHQLLDAIAIGQLTPGPVSTTTAVVGYIVAGLPGALASTFGIFLPSFVLVILTAPLIPRMRSNRFLGAFLTGINVGVIAAIGVVLVDLANAAFHVPGSASLSLLPILLAVVALVLLVRYKVNATWLIFGGAVIGLLASAVVGQF